MRMRRLFLWAVQASRERGAKRRFGRIMILITLPIIIFGVEYANAELI